MLKYSQWIVVVVSLYWIEIILKSLWIILFWGENQKKKTKQKTLIFAVCSGALISSFAEKIQITWQGRQGSLKGAQEI